MYFNTTLFYKKLIEFNSRRLSLVIKVIKYCNYEKKDIKINKISSIFQSFVTEARHKTNYRVKTSLYFFVGSKNLCRKNIRRKKQLCFKLHDVYIYRTI